MRLPKAHKILPSQKIELLWAKANDHTANGMSNRMGEIICLLEKQRQQTKRDKDRVTFAKRIFHYLRRVFLSLVLKRHEIEN